MLPTGCDSKIRGKGLYNESEYKADKDDPEQLYNHNQVSLHVTANLL